MTRRYRKYDTRNMAIGVAVAVIAASAASHPHAVTGAAHHAAAGLGTARLESKMSGTLDCAGLEALWKSAGGPVSSARIAASVAMAESGGRQYARLADPDGTTDKGYWQVNTVHGSLATYDPSGNARSAVIISGGGTDWTPWTTYDNGAYQGKC